MAKAEAWVMIPRSKDKGSKILVEAIPLVLCKDCKYYDGEGTCLDLGIAMVKGNWFCANGESKDE